MNRDFDRNNQQRKNHYADFDEHGNPVTGNTDSLSHYNPDETHSSDGRYHPDNQQSHSSRYTDGLRGYERNRRTSDARAYGDYSSGTRYGGGGSTYGGGSAYGDSYYGMSGQEGPRYRDAGRSRSGDERHGYDDRGRDDYSRQNYGRSGGNHYSGRMRDDREMGYHGTGNIYGSRPGPGSTYENTDREDRGYDRGFGGYGHTGYGSTGYDNRDVDRERSVYSNRDYRNEGRGGDWSGDNRRSNRGEDRNFDRRDRHDRDWND